MERFTTTRAGMAQPPELIARYGPVADVRIRDNDSIERWLTERYCLYTVHRGRVYRGEIHHLPWALQDAHADFMVNTMAEAAGIGLPKTAALVHFARRLEVLLWPLRRV
jgi:uncharacterized protein YqjF (DUF2071 family)